MAIEPRTRADEEQLTKALQRLVDEDPTFAARTDAEQQREEAERQARRALANQLAAQAPSYPRG